MGHHCRELEAQTWTLETPLPVTHFYEQLPFTTRITDSVPLPLYSLHPDCPRILFREGHRAATCFHVDILSRPAMDRGLVGTKGQSQAQCPLGLRHRVLPRRRLASHHALLFVEDPRRQRSVADSRFRRHL